MKNYDVVIWDFNGTLIDDVGAALASVNDMLTSRNLPLINIEQYASYVDTPIIKFYEHIFEDLYSYDFSVIAKEFDEGYERHLQHNCVMPYACEVLEEFKNKGKLQIVVSASNITKITKRLSDLGILKYFHKVLARSDYMAADKTYLAKNYFLQNNIQAEKAVVIGDCVADWSMAKELGCDCILNTKGHQSRAEFSITDAEIVDSLSQLKNLII